MTGKPNLSFYSDIQADTHLTQVVHFKKSDYDVYIGRPTKWGNPFSHKEDTVAEFRVENRREAIQRYGKWILTQPHLIRSLIELKGKTLGCWCSPKPCHGHVLVKLIERYVD